MVSNSPRKSIRKSLKSDIVVSMTPRDPTFFCQSYPLIFTFLSNYVCDVYLFISFCDGYPLKVMSGNHHFREGSRSRGVIKIFAVSLTPRDPIPRFQLHRWIRFNYTFKSAESDAKFFMLDPAVSWRPNFANGYLKYLGEFQAICLTSLARESGP
jgi:hypothetical protein